ncbi:hypothetical protein A3K70_04685 [Candidatus Bathyarchaeota archaeon RBG_16_48_13]|nr:MAG: hypothetical protein A3K70_04685 [Candidatus Bathyarchaeota archaeon RBG_16_48_13]
MTQDIRKEDAKKIVKSLNERAENLEQFGRAQADLSKINTSIGKLGVTPESSSQKSKLVSLGTALIIFPEPFGVSDVTGAAMIAAGLLAMKLKKKPLTIHEVKRDFTESIKELQKLRQTVLQQS